MFQTLTNRAPLAALIIANTIPVFGVLFYQWDAGLVILLYWSENLVVGFYNLLKMALVRPANIIGNSFAADAIYGMGKVFMIFFFMLHYGGFTAIHGIFIMEFFHIGDSVDNDITRGWPLHLAFLGILVSVLERLFANFPPGMFWPLIGLCISHGISFVFHYLLGKEYQRTTVRKLMGAPYARIIIMHVVVIVGGFLIMVLKLPAMMVLLLIALKIGTDITMHIRSHKKLIVEP